MSLHPSLDGALTAAAKSMMWPLHFGSFGGGGGGGHSNV